MCGPFPCNWCPTSIYTVGNHDFSSQEECGKMWKLRTKMSNIHVRSWNHTLCGVCGWEKETHTHTHTFQCQTVQILIYNYFIVTEFMRIIAVDLYFFALLGFASFFTLFHFHDRMGWVEMICSQWSASSSVKGRITRMDASLDLSPVKIAKKSLLPRRWQHNWNKECLLCASCVYVSLYHCSCICESVSLLYFSIYIYIFLFVLLCYSWGQIDDRDLVVRSIVRWVQDVKADSC